MSTKVNKPIENVSHTPVSESGRRRSVDEVNSYKGEVGIDDHRPLSVSQRKLQDMQSSKSPLDMRPNTQELSASKDSKQLHTTQEAKDIATPIRVISKNASIAEAYQFRKYSEATAVQRALIVGSYNEKYDIEDMGLWWTMACESRNSALEGFEAVILTLKDFERDDEQEYVISVNDKIRFITHGAKGGNDVANEAEKGSDESHIWDKWADIEEKILSQIEVFNLEESQKIETGSLLKPYFCFMKENQGLMNKYQGELSEIGEGPVLLTNKFVLALDMSKMESSQEILGKAILGDTELSQIFTSEVGWKTFDEVKSKLPLLDDFKTNRSDSTVDHGEMYDQLFKFIEPKYQKLVDLVANIVAGNISRKAPWENLRNRIEANVEEKKVEEN